MYQIIFLSGIDQGRNGNYTEKEERIKIREKREWEEGRGKVKECCLLIY